MAKEPLEVKKRANNNDKNMHQTPPPKKKPGKSERASTLCSTPPSCIKDRDCHVEYTRKEFLGEVVKCQLVLADGRVGLRDVISFRIDRDAHSPLKSLRKLH